MRLRPSMKLVPIASDYFRTKSRHGRLKVVFLYFWSVVETSSHKITPMLAYRGKKTVIMLSRRK